MHQGGTLRPLGSSSSWFSLPLFFLVFDLIWFDFDFFFWRTEEFGARRGPAAECADDTPPTVNRISTEFFCFFLAFVGLLSLLSIVVFFSSHCKRIFSVILLPSHQRFHHCPGDNRGEAKWNATWFLVLIWFYILVFFSFFFKLMAFFFCLRICRKVSLRQSSGPPSGVFSAALYRVFFFSFFIFFFWNEQKKISGRCQTAWSRQHFGAAAAPSGAADRVRLPSFYFFYFFFLFFCFVFVFLLEREGGGESFVLRLSEC